MPACCRLGLAAALATTFSVSAQTSRPQSSGEIYLSLEKLNVLGSTLYWAAHPDDENTSLLAWLAKGELLRTGYLSLTRGDGGQNLLGSQQGEVIGLIRTHELLAARRLDGAEQFFSRAYDFGFSKSPDEAFALWGRDRVLADAVWRIRSFRPDVIITRFPPDARAGHGHHTASALLAIEAFAAAADSTRFPEQLKYVRPWQARRVVWNSYSPGFGRNRPEGSDVVSEDVNAYNPLLGRSYSEIGGMSRSLHRTQGFGSALVRSDRIEYFSPLAGLKARKSIFDDLDFSWKRVAGGEKVAELVHEALRTFQMNDPAASIPVLLRIDAALDGLQDTYWQQQKKSEVAGLLRACAGLWIEATTSRPYAVPGDTLPLRLNAIQRSSQPIALLDIKAGPAVLQPSQDLQAGQQFTATLGLPLAATRSTSEPYWMARPRLGASFDVSDPQLIGSPLNTDAPQVEFTLAFAGKPFTYHVPVQFYQVRPDRGEVYEPLEIRPPLTLSLAEKVQVFTGNKPQQVQVLLTAQAPRQQGQLTLTVPPGWKCSPAHHAFSFSGREESHLFGFEIAPGPQAASGTLTAAATTPAGTYTCDVQELNFPHLPVQPYFPEATAHLVRLSVQNRARNIGYVAGAGDEVPAALHQLGAHVTLLSQGDFEKPLNGYDAIVVGVRAYNTENWLRFVQQPLLDYARQGGTVVVQYQVSGPMAVENIGPYPITLSRDRVTDENADISFLRPSHPLLNVPNKITREDFKGWVQERGLYFATAWDPHYEPVLSAHDPGEKPLTGGLLVAPCGKGYWIYTGYAFFRQLPAGVPGAYRLFANLISLGKK